LGESAVTRGEATHRRFAYDYAQTNLGLTVHSGHRHGGRPSHLVFAYNPGYAPNVFNGACGWGGSSQFEGTPYSRGTTWENTSDCNALSVVHWAWDGSAYVQFGGVSGSGTAIAILNWTTPTSWVTSDHAGLWINWPYATSSLAN
jgi:hypothetical protein